MAGAGPLGDQANESDREGALACLAALREETMVAAWGTQRSADERRRIVRSALILGHKLEEMLAQRQDELRPEEAQRFLMPIMNDTVVEFARQEGVSQDDATAFLGDVSNRDLVLEFNEALEAARGTGLTLDEQLCRIVEARRDRAIWSDHWSSG